MHETIDYLLKSDSRIVGYYQKVKNLWQGILQKPEASDEDSLAKILHLEQWKFEQECDGHRGLAKELIAVVGITQFYDIRVGFEGKYDRALLVYNAIKKSSCSLEVKYHADDIAKFYGLVEEM